MNATASFEFSLNTFFPGESTSAVTLPDSIWVISYRIWVKGKLETHNYLKKALKCNSLFEDILGFLAHIRASR